MNDFPIRLLLLNPFIPCKEPGSSSASFFLHTQLKEYVRVSQQHYPDALPVHPTEQQTRRLKINLRSKARNYLYTHLIASFPTTNLDQSHRSIHSPATCRNVSSFHSGGTCLTTTFVLLSFPLLMLTISSYSSYHNIVHKMYGNDS